MTVRLPQLLARMDDRDERSVELTVSRRRYAGRQPVVWIETTSSRRSARLSTPVPLGWPTGLIG